MRNQAKLKRKRGRSTITPPETTVHDNSNAANSPATTESDAVISLSNVELINSNSPPASSHQHRRGRARGRPRKSPTPEPPATRGLPSSIPPGANGPLSPLVNAENAVARVVPSMDSVVKVFCVHTEPNFSLPWQRKRQYSSSSSGFVIKG